MLDAGHHAEPGIRERERLGQGLADAGGDVREPADRLAPDQQHLGAADRERVDAIVAVDAGYGAEIEQLAGAEQREVLLRRTRERPGRHQRAVLLAERGVALDPAALGEDGGVEHADRDLARDHETQRARERLRNLEDRVAVDDGAMNETRADQPLEDRVVGRGEQLRAAERSPGRIGRGRGGGGDHQRLLFACFVRSTKTGSDVVVPSSNGSLS